nr:E3 ubiquitin-protein ligase UPL2-like [Tanacetum cinerariifolium]
MSFELHDCLPAIQYLCKNMLGEKVACRYNWTFFGMLPRSRRGESSRRGEQIGSILDTRRSTKPIDTEGAPLVDTDDIEAMIRLLRVVQVEIWSMSWISCDIAFSVAPAWDKDDARVGVDLIKELRRSNTKDGHVAWPRECSKFKRWGGLWDQKLSYVFG